MLADVVLPVTGDGERAGTTTNLEGRVTRLAAKVVPPGVAWPAWIIATELADRLGGDLGFETLEAIGDEIERVAPALSRAAPAPCSLVADAATGSSCRSRRHRWRIGRRHAGPSTPIDPIATPGIASVGRAGRADPASATGARRRGGRATCRRVPARDARRCPDAGRLSLPAVRSTPARGPPSPPRSIAVLVAARRPARLYDHGTPRRSRRRRWRRSPRPASCTFIRSELAQARRRERRRRCGCARPAASSSVAGRRRRRGAERRRRSCVQRQRRSTRRATSALIDASLLGDRRPPGDPLMGDPLFAQRRRPRASSHRARQGARRLRRSCSSR